MVAAFKVNSFESNPRLVLDVLLLYVINFAQGSVYNTSGFVQECTSQLSLLKKHYALSPSTSMDLLLFRHSESRKNELAHEQIFGHVNISAGKQEAFKALKLV